MTVVPHQDLALTTERLTIREFVLTDATFILRLLNEKSFLLYIGDKGVRTLEDARNYLRSGPIASYRSHGIGLFHVAEISSGTPVGMCGLLKRDEHQHPDIGFAFLPEYQAQGYALESAKAVLNYAHKVLNIDTIVAFVDPANERSIRLLRRAGLRLAGPTKLNGSAVAEYIYGSGSPI